MVRFPIQIMKNNRCNQIQSSIQMKILNVGAEIFCLGSNQMVSAQTLHIWLIIGDWIWLYGSFFIICMGKCTIIKSTLQYKWKYWMLGQKSFVWGLTKWFLPKNCMSTHLLKSGSVFTMISHTKCMVIATLDGYTFL